MSPIALGAMLAIVFPASLLVWLAFSTDRSGARNVQVNLGLTVKASEGVASLSQQYTGLILRLTPGSYVAWLDRQLAAAGRPKKWPLERLLVTKPLLALGAGVVGTLNLFAGPSPMKLAVLVGALALGYFAPDLLIRSHGQKRRASIQLELPNALDQMLISVQAGLGFEAAMGRTGKNGTGPLADEFVRTLQDIQVGRSRKEAYLAMADRVDVADLRSFIRSIVQADAYGIAIAKVLDSQAQEMRTKRRQRAEEHAMKMPVKILFPLILFIFPTLFIILLGPTVMNIMAALS